MAWNIHLHQYLMGCALMAGGGGLRWKWSSLTSDFAL